MTTFSFSRRPARPHRGRPAEVLLGFMCPVCSVGRTEVKDSRPTDEGIIRRRRLCSACGHRFSTIEIAEFDPDGNPLVDTANSPILRAIRALDRTLREALDKLEPQ